MANPPEVLCWQSGVWARRKRISLVSMSLTLTATEASAYTTQSLPIQRTQAFLFCYTLFQNSHEWPLQFERCVSLCSGAGFCAWLLLIPLL